MSPAKRTITPEFARAVVRLRLAQVAALRSADPWRAGARANQLAPEGAWSTWLIMAGRGFGKTRSGAEWIREEVMAGRMQRIALVGRTAADVRDVMVEGESGLLACCERYAFAARYQPSRRRIVFANGAKAYLYSADEPNLLRGPQHDGAWSDEVAAWQKKDAWDQLQFGLRLIGPLGDEPRQIATTTPRPVPVVRAILAQAGTVITRGSTYENRANLANAFFETIIGQYEGTRLGRQELEGELLDQLEGALWTYEQLDQLRERWFELPPEERAPLRRVVVAVDPPASDGPRSAECGIVAAGVRGHGRDSRGLVLGDRSRRGSPNEWGAAAWRAAEEFDADAVVIEVNQGGDMAVHVLQATKPAAAKARVIRVHASRGKLARAEPVAALYEQKRVTHAEVFRELEDQMCTYLPDELAKRRKSETDEDQASPDRLDALVWALTELMVARPAREAATISWG